MLCPHCGYRESKTLQTRLAIKENTVRRRHECLECGLRWTTREEVTHMEDDRPAKVTRQNGFHTL